MNAQTCPGDVTPPIAVCNEAVALALDATGQAVVSANTFDDGSYDNNPFRFEAARPFGDACGGGNQFGATSTVLLCRYWSGSYCYDESC